MDARRAPIERDLGRPKERALEASGAYAASVQGYSIALVASAAEPARAEELRHALSIARDHMRVMANWFKHREPVEHRFAESAITIVDAVLERGEPT
ncbi:hypothetical protein ACKZDW_02170 (plasmid) [Ralstonia syzygii subsp. celebesensis]|uniref:hypothetical protein n=1 Tax=Ralstonia syzygii TaxID=28097 RepID=UPI00387E0BB4